VADCCECHDEFRGFHKMQGTSLDEVLLASQERLFHVVSLKFESEPETHKLSVGLCVFKCFKKMPCHCLNRGNDIIIYTKIRIT
jgi:hypothetical protein